MVPRTIITVTCHLQAATLKNMIMSVDWQNNTVGRETRTKRCFFFRVELGSGHPV